MLLLEDTISSTTEDIVTILAEISPVDRKTFTTEYITF